MGLGPLSTDADAGFRAFGPVVRRRGAGPLPLGGLALLLLLTAPYDAGAQINVLFWSIQEVYSNADGSIQYVELYTTFDNQDLVATNGLEIRAESGTTTRTFTFDSDLPGLLSGKTADHTLLIGSAGYQALSVPPQADYGPLDAGGPFFDPTAPLVIISLVQGAFVLDQVAFDPAAITSDCSESLNFPGFLLVLNSPENFEGDTSFPLTCCTDDDECPSDTIECTLSQCDVAARTCSYLPIDAVCDDGVFCNGAESCDPILGCQTGPPTDPDDGVDCTDDSCDEDGDVVTHVPDDLACDDGDACTADSCDAVTGCGNAPIKGCQVAVPALSAWGLALMAGLLLTAGPRACAAS